MSDMAKDCETIRAYLRDNKLSYVWLVHELNKRDLRVTPPRLGDVLTLRTRGWKSQQIILACISIINRYERTYIRSPD